MNCNKFSRSSQRHYLMMLVLFGILTACYQPDPNKAQLVVTTVGYTGNSDEFFEYRSGETSATAKIQHVYNFPTGYDARVGALSSVYEAITGKAPNDPTRIQTVESILRLMKQEGWKVVDDTSQKSHSGGATKSVRTIRFRQPAN